MELNEYLLSAFEDGSNGLCLLGQNADKEQGLFNELLSYINFLVFEDGIDDATEKLNGSAVGRRDLARQVIEDVNDHISEATNQDSENYMGLDDCGFFDTHSQEQLTARIFKLLNI